MTRPLTRDERFTLLRTSERRWAEANLAKAQADLARLADLSQRLDGLRRTMGHAIGAAHSLDLQLVGEMSDHLLRARGALDAPMQAAAQTRDQKMTAVQHATARQEGLESHLCEARRAAQRAAEIRADAVRIARRSVRGLRLVGGESA